ncbi:hypothetical protein ADMFC3_00170 [Geovibrio sp. ADMFC3]
MSIPFRKRVPKRRTDIKEKASYGKYKDELRSDFECRCGYCDDHDNRLGGSRTYHIDHVAPRSLFPNLEITYSNLVYSCPFCNGSKSNKELIHNRYGVHHIDPCNEQYDECFTRKQDGSIRAVNEMGEFLYKTLNLGLARHSIAWSMDHIEITLEKIETKVADLPDSEETCQIMREFAKLCKDYINYNKSINQ